MSTPSPGPRLPHDKPPHDKSPHDKSRRLPDTPSLEHLKNEARNWQRGIRAGDPAVTATATAYAPDGRIADPSGIDLSTAQWLLARSYGFASWPRLRHYLDVVAAYTRRPRPAPAEQDAPSGSDDQLDDHRGADNAAGDTQQDLLLRLGVLNYTRDRPDDIPRAERLLQADPGLGSADVFAMAATGRGAELAAVLRDDPAAAFRSGGPHDWPPLLYCCLSRIGDQDGAVDVVEQLLAAGADANSGFLWYGLPSAFTALTGALGGGEQSQPPHPRAIEIGRLLLTAGADPNDNQALYNRMFTPQNDYLELLFEFGLGTERPSPWRDRLGSQYPTPEQMVGEQLRWAADHGFVGRVRLLLDHGVSPDNRGYHPIFGDRTALELARAAGHADIVQLLSSVG